MKILETQSATLTNHEVLTHLTTHPRLSASLSLSVSADDKPRHSNTTTIVSEVVRYLTSSSSSLKASAHANAPPANPNINTDTNANTNTNANTDTDTSINVNDNISPLPPPLSTPQIQNLVHALSRYNLTKAETLMILNLGVRELGLLDCVVEECDERLGSEEQEALCAVVGGCFGAGGGEGEVRMVDV